MVDDMNNDFQKILLEELSKNNTYISSKEDIYNSILDDLSTNEKDFILINQFLYICVFAEKLNSDNSGKLQQIMDDFNNGPIDRFLVFKLKYVKKLNNNDVFKTMPDDILDLFGDLIEVMSAFLKIFVCINSLYNNETKYESIKNLNTLTDNNLFSKLTAKKNNINWDFVLKDLNKPLRNADKHLRYVYDSRNHRIIASKDGMLYFEIDEMTLYRITVRVMNIINCFVSMGELSSLINEDNNKSLELKKVLVNNMTIARSKEILSIFKPEFLQKNETKLT